MNEPEFRAQVIPLQKPMYALALRMGLSADDAADAVQDTLVSLWRHRCGIPADPLQLRHYCLASARNTCLASLRSANVCVDLDNASAVCAERDDRTEYLDLRAHVEAVIESLPAGQRRAIRLSAFLARDNREIASEMGETENNVRQLLSRGRRRLREFIGAYAEKL